MLETSALGGGGGEFGGRVGKSASGVKEKPKREQRSARRCNQKISEPAIFAIPVHGSFTGFRSSRRNSYGKAQSVLFGIVDLITRAWLFGSTLKKGEPARFR